MDKVDVSSIEMREYAQSLGWQLVKEALADGLFVLNSPDKDKGDYTQLSFPKDCGVYEYNESALLSLRTLSEMYSKSIPALIEEIREVNDDVISLRYYSDSKVVNSISFEEAYDAIGATRQMLLAAASTVVNPQTYHPKLNRTEPQELIKKTRFRHTQEGSFIIKVSIPFEPTRLSTPLFDLLPDTDVDRPIGRKTVELVSLASQAILDSVDANSVAELWDVQSKSKQPIISYNFCDSLLKMFDEERELPFELIFNWSRASFKTYRMPIVARRLVFPFSYKSKIEEVKDIFFPKKEEMTGVFYGTVEQLNGDTGVDGKRSGEIILALLIENDIVRGRVNLNADQYQIAIKAHERGGAYVMIKSKVNRKTRIAAIDNIAEFKLAAED